ncbi:MAG TPA: hypothetical protein VGP37_05930 [Candidatus Nanopelagicales bacterium]|nr:hypothetical protein [Candidatus Nanopelagicales bacterium]
MTDSTVQPQSQAASSSIVDLQTSVVAAREELVSSLVALKAETAPKALAQRGLGAAKGWFTDEYGGIRPERVAIAGAIVIGYVALKALGRRRR